MAKCIRCGKSTLARGHVKLADSTICTPCFKSLGFKIISDAAVAASYRYDDIKDGKDAMYSARVKDALSKELEEFRIMGMSHENENGEDIQQILKDYIEEECADDKLTNAEVKEELEYEDRVYLYPTIDGSFALQITTFEEAPAVKVYFDTSYDDYQHIGWIPKSNVEHVIDLITKHDCDITGEIIGGPYKYLDEDDEIRSDSTNFGGRLYIAYK